MKALTLAAFSLLVLMSCGKEDPAPAGPKSLSISNSAIYELLPAEATVGVLSSDDPNATFQLVSGDGADNNSDFKIAGTLLRTSKMLDYSDGATRSIRLAASDASGSLEQQVSIEIKEIAGTYPSITSPSFADGEEMPRDFGADNGNKSPDLEIADIPSNTVTMALTMKDLDDGNSIHWNVWNIPKTKTKINKGGSWQQGVVEGNTDFGDAGYTGPFPPNKHRYETTIYFLEGSIDLQPTLYAQLPTKFVGQLIAQTSIVGTYTP